MNGRCHERPVDSPYLTTAEAAGAVCEFLYRSS